MDGRAGDDAFGEQMKNIEKKNKPEDGREGSFLYFFQRPLVTPF
jgi:hypothetical protein